jgi:putative membrane protein
MTSNSSRFPLILLGLYLVTFVICAIAPYDRDIWFAENAPIVLIVAAIAWVSRHHRFSNTAYVLMTVLPILHTIGGHFTFERVPFDWVTDTFGFERNHYDRMTHFTVGFFAYPLAEYFASKRLVAWRFLVLVLPVLIILAVAGGYEIFEWIFAISSDPATGAAVLGSQGDIWDAQKDMLADTLGAMLAMVLFAVQSRSRENESLEKYRAGALTRAQLILMTAKNRP